MVVVDIYIKIVNSGLSNDEKIKKLDFYTPIC